jgi:integrase
MPSARLMRSHTGLYHVEAYVPVELRRIVGRGRVVKSLSTRDPLEAEERAPAVAKEIVTAIENLRAEVVVVKPKVVLPSVLALLKSGKDIEPPPSSQGISRAMEDLFVLNSETTFGLAEADSRALWHNVNRLIEQFDIPVDRLSTKHWALCRSIARLQREAAVTGASMPASATLFKDRLNNEEHKAFLESATLAEVIACFRREHGERWNAQRAQRYTHLFALMAGLLGASTKIRSLTRRDFVEARSILDRLSPRFMWYPETRHLPLREAAMKCVELGLPRRSVTTVNHMMKGFRSLMIYAEAEGFVDRNVTVKLFRAPRPDQVTHVLPFSGEQLQRFFTVDPHYQPDLPFEQRDERFWIPAIALYAGLRIGEAAQLYAVDVGMREGIPAIEVSAAETSALEMDKYLKTFYSHRVVPMHPVLQRMGLLEYAKLMRSKGELKLFPGARRGWMMRFDKLAKQMQHDLKAAGVATANHSPRSFRHNFRDALRNVKAPDDIVRLLGGWQQKTVADGYGTGPYLSTLYSYVCSTSYRGVDLSHLMVTEPLKLAPDLTEAQRLSHEDAALLSMIGKLNNERGDGISTVS